ncbi:hypothetical protein Poly51_23160 [Rubripirellula tenax]|uniref:SLA1 homology domain-containing protein n=1 Tax=Rubripirellula tenax TaxID=2528015 RepID=A0A5C6F8F6_9BACT|nr:SHD1 domain-containing protein [Rubripirellula tenax]TWU56406.1 hypothetical protein Poly51_23160 [Rubripirellula tenax]
MHRRPTRTRLAILRSIALSTLTGIAITASNAGAQNVERIWVDAGGSFSVKATMINAYDNSVVLLRSDGGEITLSLDKLSEQDKAYVAEQKQFESTLNGLRAAPPSPPKIVALEPLKIPFDASEAEAADAPLQFDGPIRQRVSDHLPASIPADRSPMDVSVADARIMIQRVDFNIGISPPIAINTLDASGNSKTSLIMSISEPIRLPDQITRQELVRFELDRGSADVMMRHNETLRLLDHHLESGRSLVAVGFNSLGSGGSLAVLEGWQDGGLELSHRKELPPRRSAGGVPRLRWAKWIDQNHALAVIDETLGLWNITTGKQLYQIEGIDKRAALAVSGGGRYVAIPYEGGVDLWTTATGDWQGRIKVEKQVPGVSFSPLGNQLAIATTRRVRAWDLPSAALAGDVRSRNSLGTGTPFWIDHDMLITDSGTLVSLYRGVPIWRYDVAGSDRTRIGSKLAIFRKSPITELVIATLPHAGAESMIRRIDHSVTKIEPESWQVAGRSAWEEGQWVDRDVKIGSLTKERR